MRDGVHLAADLYLPGPETPSAVVRVLEYIPYRQGRGRTGHALLRIPRPPRLRRGASGHSQEQLDGYDAIEWLAAQPFCDGHVNQMGISYGGFTSLQVARHAPPLWVPKLVSCLQIADFSGRAPNFGTQPSER
jgi:uncharacterized protein